MSRSHQIPEPSRADNIPDWFPGVRAVGYTLTFAGWVSVLVAHAAGRGLGPNLVVGAGVVVTIIGAWLLGTRWGMRTFATDLAIRSRGKLWHSGASVTDWLTAGAVALGADEDELT